MAKESEGQATTSRRIWLKYCDRCKALRYFGEGSKRWKCPKCKHSSPEDRPEADTPFHLVLIDNRKNST